MGNAKFSAVIFDLDGVITNTASIHSKAWQIMFDNFLEDQIKNRSNETNKELGFFSKNDYLTFVDGKPRYKGVKAFLSSRNIVLPYGDPSDKITKKTICGLGNCKNKIFNELIIKEGVEVYESTINLIYALKKNGVKIGVASSSKNCKTILKTSRILNLFDTLVDGITSVELKLNGKPEPDIFITACDNLGIDYSQAAVVEDAISGIKAGVAGHFGLVIGVSRRDNSHDLLISGADIVVKDLKEIDIARMNDWFDNGLNNDKWSLSYYDYIDKEERIRESLLTIGNGYFATRGANEENCSNEINYPGTYIAGVFNNLESNVAGKKVHNEDMVNCPNWLPITFKIEDGNWFDINDQSINIISFKRQLDFRSGCYTRNILAKDRDEKEFRVISSRLINMDNPHIASLKYELFPLNFSANLSFKIGLDGSIINDGVERYRNLNSKHLEVVFTQPMSNTKAKDNLIFKNGNVIFLLAQTNQSKIKIAFAQKIRIILNGKEINPEKKLLKNNTESIFSTFSVKVEEHDKLVIEKIVTVFTSRDYEVKEKNPLSSALSLLSDLNSFDEVYNSSKSKWKELWVKADIVVEGDRFIQKLIRLNIFHLFVTVSQNSINRDTSIPARGLHGESYRGHIFWDTLFILPFLKLNFPDIVKSVLMYRYNRLDKARELAKNLGLEGASFPWQSASSGKEETQTLHLNPLSGEWGKDNSSLQRHVSLAIAYNIWAYFWVTNDEKFIDNYGLEMFIEICRFWVSKATFNERMQKYDILEVMGPDEFHEQLPNEDRPGLKNNFYTNVLVAWVISKGIILIKKFNRQDHKEIFKKIDFKEKEIKKWEKISKNLILNISNDGIFEQFEEYFRLKEIDLDYYKNKYGNIHRMDRILKSEGKTPNSYKISKQADTLMLFYLFDEAVVRNIIKELNYNTCDDYLLKNFNYYFERTSHGSTLSKVVYSFLYNLMDQKDSSYELYTDALQSDYSDIQGGTTAEGIHTGVMASTVMLTLRSYIGLDLDKDYLVINPKLPKRWRKVSFRLEFKQDIFYFKVSKSEIEVKIFSSTKNNVTIKVCKDIIEVNTNKWKIIKFNS